MSVFLRFLMSRVTVVALLILAQISLITLSVNYFWDYMAIYYGLSTVIALMLVCRIVSKHDNPAYKIAWIILILTVPPFGCAMYVIFSGNTLAERVKKKLAGMYSVMRVLPKEYKFESGVDFESSVSKRQSDYITQCALCPPYTETDCTYFPTGEKFFPILLEKLENAENFIFLEYFIIDKGEMWDKIHEVLKRKAAAGVDVRIIYDDMGCITHLDTGFNRFLGKEGIKCHVFNRFIPVLSAVMNNRNHRKICVIDGKIGFTGGLNIADEYINVKHPYGYWKDNAVMLEGKAVYSLTLMFLSMWESLEDPKMQMKHEIEYERYFPKELTFDAGEGIVQPYTDNPLDTNTVGESIYLNMIYAATRYVWIMTPYLIIDHNMEQALCNTAKSGIDVRIIVPGIPDKKLIYEATKSSYGVLLEAGVKIYEYSPGFLHSKTFLCDDKYGTVGTVNLDYRSLYLHFECGVWFNDAPVLKDIKTDFENTFEESVCINKDCGNVNIVRRAIRSILKVMAPLI